MMVYHSQWNCIEQAQLQITGVFHSTIDAAVFFCIFTHLSITCQCDSFDIHLSIFGAC